MQTVRHILSAILIFAVLVSGLPSFIPEDANRDSRVDLKDAVLHIQDFARTADNPETFAANFENAVSALQALAGLKTVIKPADNAKSVTASPTLDSPYLISSFDFLFAQATYSKPAGQSFYYQSILFSPDSPPPQASSIC
ncbi:MAG: hypothetical protein SRB1_02530 [Desulfobacteraceae bacterium Eth-SRB1]|nr:MAG: hypothetical protein SRB1_02530 [Desulfobacteraceae bacterium Eth-SRB1]